MEIILIVGLLMFVHWIADWTHLSTNWMLAAKSKGTPVFPIFCHALVHSVLMSFVVFLFASSLETAAIALFVQLVSHTAIDVTKGRVAASVPVTANITKRAFWYVLGFDQLLHQIVILTMVAIIV
jgi:hypothetical protein